MKHINFSILAVIGLILTAFTGSILAQSSDRDNPTPLTSDLIGGSLNNNGEESFYSFVAGPGQLTITVDVKAKSGEIGVLNFELLDKNAADSLLCCEFAQADGGGTGRVVKSIKLTKRQTVILHTTNGPVGGGTFRILLTGAISVSGASTNNTGNKTSNQETENRNTGRVSVPAAGTLHIKMKDGSTKDLDLSLIREISVQ
jgi:hypothetical protein